MTVGGVCAVLFLFASGGACVNPRDQYDDYLDRTADARGGIAPVSDASFEGNAPDGGFMATYAQVCYPHLFMDPSNALLFVSQAAFAPDGTGGGMLTMTIQPLVKHATDLSQMTGPATTYMTHVDSSAHFDLNLAPLTLPKEANPIQASDVVFSAAVFHGILQSEDKFCAGFEGQVTSPIMLPLDPTLDFCLFKKASGPMDAVPMYQTSDFHCP
jgi:hypothetical protein